jgi:hypothetical protein
MTIQRSWGPLVVVGQNPAIGSTTGSGLAPPPYVSGSNENPDDGPSVFFGGVALRDMRIFSRPDGAGLVAGGYSNQDFGFVSNETLTVDLAPSLVATANIAALQHTTAATPLTLVSSSGAGITVLTAPYTVPGTLNVIPSGALRIDANPAYIAYGTSGAIEGWSPVACDRALSFTTSASMAAVSLTAHGYDVYGYPRTQTKALPGSATTVQTLKGFKWITSIVASATDGTNNVSVGTADIYSFPLRADAFCDVNIWWNNTLITAATGFVAAVTTDPNTAAIGDTRGTYAIQGDTADGTKRLQIVQRVRSANVGSVTGMFGVTAV